MQIEEDRNRVISERAYAIWEREGRPHGRDGEHWRMAEAELGLVAEGQPRSSRKGRTHPVKARGMAGETDESLSRKSEAAPSRTRGRVPGGAKAGVTGAGKRVPASGTRTPPTRRK